MGYLRLREIVVKRITVIKFGVSNGSRGGTSCCGIELRMNTRKLAYMIIAIFGAGQNFAGKDEWANVVCIKVVPWWFREREVIRVLRG